MRSILVNADRRPGMDVRLNTALSLARASNGHVTLLVDTPVARYISMDPMGGSYVASDALKQAMADDDASAARLEERLSRDDVPFDVIRSEAEPVEALAKAARLADVVVMSRSGGFAGELALVSRTPVLALSDDSALTMPLGKACVAWDGGDEAACALRNAVGLLSGCESVAVLTVAEKPGGFPATEALRYLSRHGVTAELQELPRRGSTEETLDVAVGRSGADLLVMGAFGHSRVREYLFGGVTRYFLDKSDGPALLLTH
ncbi:MAG: universal stress protein [Sphingomonadaceae bacterium]|nr:universal stress protein [Sphingomonadaceae bacterium]